MLNHLSLPEQLSLLKKKRCNLWLVEILCFPGILDGSLNKRGMIVPFLVRILILFLNFRAMHQETVYSTLILKVCFLLRIMISQSEALPFVLIQGIFRPCLICRGIMNWCFHSRTTTLIMPEEMG